MPQFLITHKVYLPCKILHDLFAFNVIVLAIWQIAHAFRQGRMIWVQQAARPILRRCWQSRVDRLTRDDEGM
jgi:hypothetical protein